MADSIDISDHSLIEEATLSIHVAKIDSRREIRR